MTEKSEGQRGIAVVSERLKKLFDKTAPEKDEFGRKIPRQEFKEFGKLGTKAVIEMNYKLAKRFGYFSQLYKEWSALMGVNYERLRRVAKRGEYFYEGSPTIRPKEKYGGIITTIFSCNPSNFPGLSYGPFIRDAEVEKYSFFFSYLIAQRLDFLDFSKSQNPEAAFADAKDRINYNYNEFEGHNINIQHPTRPYSLTIDVNKYNYKVAMEKDPEKILITDWVSLVYQIPGNQMV